MGGHECKVVIDYYGAVTAEANAINAGDFPLRMKEEAMLLGTSIKAMCDTYQLAKDYIKNEPGGLGQRGVNLSYEVCNWAKTMRKWRDAVRGEKHVTPEVQTCCDKMRAWRDKIVAFYTDIAEDGMRDDGYVLPVAGSDGYYIIT